MEIVIAPLIFITMISIIIGFFAILGRVKKG